MADQIYPVTTTTDTSSTDPGTLEYALTNAQSGDTIQFKAANAYTLPTNFALPAGTLTLDLLGTGAANTTTAVSIGGGLLTDPVGGKASLVVVDSATSPYSAGTLTLSSANTYSGATTVGGTGSTAVTLQGGVADAFGTNSAVSLFGSTIQVNALDGSFAYPIEATLDLGGFDQHIGSLADAPGSTATTPSPFGGQPTANEVVTNSGANAATLHTGADNTSTTFSGSIENGSQTGRITALDKTGTGTFTLLGASSYTGGTTLNGGTLELGARGAAGQTQTGSQTAGGVAFAARNTTLQIDNAALTPPNAQTPQPVPDGPGPVLLLKALATTPPASNTTQGSYAGPVTNFATGETLDLSGLTYAPGTTTATLSGTTLTVTNGTLTDTLTDFTLGEDLPAGSYSFQTAQDANTTQGTVVTLVLNAPATPALAPGQDTGASATDGLTDINRPQFTGTGATPNSTITLYDGTGTTAIGTGTSDANGNYTATVTAPLADGSHSITATATTAGGNVSARSAADAITVDTTAPTASSVTDTVAQNSGPTPIGLAAPSDNLTAAGNLAVAAGALPTNGLVTLANGTPVVSGQALTAAQLTGLLFTPAGTTGQGSTFTYTVTDGAGNASLGAATLNVGAANTAPTPTPTPTPTPQPTPTPAPDTIAINQQVSYDGSAFAITGRVSAATGVRSVEISAVVDGGAVQDLGAATVAADGTFTLKDAIGASLQGFITATETNGAGGTTSTQANYSLQGGLDQPNTGRAPFVAEQDVYNADGSATTSVSLFRGDGSPTNDASRRTTIMAAGQTFTSDQFDDFKNGGTPNTTFVFNQNHGLDTISLFRPDNVDHDTLSFKGSDFGNSIANVLQNTRQTTGGAAVIYDPVTGDTVKLVNISKQTLTTYAQQDITFHA